MTATEWLERFATMAGIARPTDDEIETLLDLAGIAAHSSARIAAPITCWLAGRAGLEIDVALAYARSISATFDAPEPPT
jgi:hypothetical protein